MASLAAAGFVGSFFWAVLLMAAVLRSVVAVRESESDPDETDPERVGAMFCGGLNQKQVLEAFELTTENCTLSVIDEMCEAYYTKIAATTVRSVAHSTLFFSRKRAWCNRVRVAKQDVAFQAENKPDNTIAKSVQACEQMAWKNCVEVTCPTLCSLKQLKNCNCNEKCYTTFTHMWFTGSLSCEPDKWQECMEEKHEELEKAHRDWELEAISREHLLKCVCVSRLDDDGVCYAGGQGIPHGKRWCDFNNNPSWQKLLLEKPSEWEESDWKPGHQPDCSLKEPLKDLSPDKPLKGIWKQLGLE